MTRGQPIFGWPLAVFRESRREGGGVGMYLDHFSASLVRICDAEGLSYERAAKRCRCSASHFGNIIRRKSSPTLDIVEHICLGFQTTPNELIQIAVPNFQQQQLAYRLPMQVTAARLFRFQSGETTFPICPRCGCTFEREYQAYCDRCGQMLSWKKYKNATVIQDR